jgi:hypothetical protein
MIWKVDYLDKKSRKITTCKIPAEGRREALNEFNREHGNCRIFEFKRWKKHSDDMSDYRTNRYNEH